MARRDIDFKSGIPEGFYWLNEPDSYRVDSCLAFRTLPDSDFWQRTHYGFRRDTGHCLVTDLKGDFTMTLHCKFQYSELYHQAGIILYIDSENWIKASIEYENEENSKLGSVVTNLGWSDWATSDISSKLKDLWYRLHKREGDCAVESSVDGEAWSQMRVAHLHVLGKGGGPAARSGDGFRERPRAVRAGLYACSPLKKSFEAHFDSLHIEDCMWTAETD